MRKTMCPCCGYYTIESNDEVIVEICDVCFWQYDVVAHMYPDRSIGANHISLNQARENYIQFGVCKKEYDEMVRKPLPCEFPEYNIK
ncbi:CPCC family cysteine-rich protein [Paenibacillus sp. P46E]|uniref:CPCC family cysteine-rich protein n=1 Tax=Paenibacillus sp. P46E TaxID=1349436 RepID=UPI00093A86E4|nr:CPCC family cysteine-rich protein [Paenibacillus sp. P46E]